MACHGAPSQRPSKLSQACWCVFPWPCGKFDRVKNSPRRIQVVRVPVLAGPTEKCGHLVVSLSGTMTHLACSKFLFSGPSQNLDASSLVEVRLASQWVVEASSVTRSARKVVALGEAFTGISLARRGKFPIIRKCTMGGSSWSKPRAAVFDAISNVSPVASSSEKCALLRCRPGPVHLASRQLARKMGSCVVHRRGALGRGCEVLGQWMGCGYWLSVADLRCGLVVGSSIVVLFCTEGLVLGEPSWRSRSHGSSSIIRK
ncbi:hypothetical protein Lal_00043485 [Lupinus albus]|nr:hypothetical protein Lal_00043485 [Lupinus albus]